MASFIYICILPNSFPNSIWRNVKKEKNQVERSSLINNAARCLSYFIVSTTTDNNNLRVLWNTPSRSSSSSSSSSFCWYRPWHHSRARDHLKKRCTTQGGNLGRRRNLCTRKGAPKSWKSFRKKKKIIFKKSERKESFFFLSFISFKNVQHKTKKAHTKLGHFRQTMLERSEIFRTSARLMRH